MPSPLVHSPNLSALYEELCRTPPSALHQIFPYWIKAGLFTVKDEEQFMEAPHIGKLVASRLQMVPILESIDKKYRHHVSFPINKAEKKETKRLRSGDELIKDIETFQKSRAMSPGKQKRKPQLSERTIRPALYVALSDLAVEMREGFDLLRTFNKALKKALSEEKVRWLNLQRLCNANRFLFTPLGKDLEKDISTKASAAVAHINTAQIYVREAEERIAEMNRSHLGQKSQVVPRVGARLVTTLERAFGSRKIAFNYAYKLMRACDPKRVGKDPRSLERNVSRVIALQQKIS
jgi:hypothetical protein